MTRRHETDRAARPCPRTEIAPEAQARSHGWPKTYRVLARDAKAEATAARDGKRTRCPRARPKVRGGSAMAEQSYDRLDGVIWYDGKLVPWSRCQDACAHPRAALRQLRVRGRARLWRRDLQVHRTFGTAQALGAGARFRNPLHGRRDRCGQTPGPGEERAAGRLCAAGRLARLGDDGRLGAEQHDPPRHRHLAVAELFRSGAASSRASGSTWPTIAGPIRRPRRCSPRRRGST